MSYVTHARTADELRLELCGDLRRRIAMLDAQRNAVKFSEAEKARIARALNELGDMLHYWSEIEIIKPTKGKK